MNWDYAAAPTLHLNVIVPICLQSVCKAEANTRPCPRLVLVCCAALVTHGLETENLFLEEAPLDLVHFLIGSFQEGESQHMYTCVYTLHKQLHAFGKTT